MKRLDLLFAITALALLPASAPALAQSDNGEVPSAAAPCQAEPSDGTAPRDQQESLSEQLDECNSVLEPPAHADHEIEEQPPDVGRTPVIPPGELPEQQPDPV